MSMRGDRRRPDDARPETLWSAEVIDDALVKAVRDAASESDKLALMEAQRRLRIYEDALNDVKLAVSHLDDVILHRPFE